MTFTYFKAVLFGVFGGIFGGVWEYFLGCLGVFGGHVCGILGGFRG